jgi:hypothetical protein
MGWITSRETTGKGWFRHVLCFNEVPILQAFDVETLGVGHLTTKKIEIEY